MTSPITDKGFYFPSTKYLIGKDIKTVFSDRTWCPWNTNSDYICLGDQKFDYRKQDISQIYLYSTSKMKVVLTTWGNSAYTFDLECKNGFMYGTMVEPNGNSMFVINLQNSKIGIIKWSFFSVYAKFNYYSYIIWGIKLYLALEYDNYYYQSLIFIENLMLLSGTRSLTIWVSRVKEITKCNR